MIADIINLLIYVIVGFILINIISVMGVMVYYKLKKLSKPTKAKSNVVKWDIDKEA
tara:strand:- start:187 stop:354 length:168 start_codon:yes stop_codon:yes gene_type:complete